MDVEQINLGELLEAMSRSASNGIDKPRFRTLVNELKNFPRTRERLAIESLSEALRCVERKVEPGTLVGWLLSWSEAVPPSRTTEFLLSLEDLAKRYFAAVPEIDRCMPEITLPRLLHTVSRIGGVRRGAALAQMLKSQCGTSDAGDPRADIISEFERSSKA